VASVLQSFKWNGTDGGSGVSSSAHTYTAGSTLAVFSTCDATGRTLTATDASDTITSKHRLVTSGSIACAHQIFEAKNIAGGSTTIVLHGNNGDGIGGMVLELSGVDPAGAWSANVIHDGTAAITATPTSGTSGNSNEVAIAIACGSLIATGAGETVTAGTGYTQDQSNQGSVFPGMSVEHKVLAAQAAQTATFNITAAINSQAVVSCFNAAASGATLFRSRTLSEVGTRAGSRQVQG
jgi:hypothetical protein